MIELILSYLESLGVDNSSVKAERLFRYAKEIELFSKTLSLVGDKELESIIVNHILDSASGYPLFERSIQSGSRVGDIGTGAGLPGIVLSVLFDNTEFFLVERMEKRLGFLRGVLISLGLKNVTLIEKDYKDVDERFNVITCRAFHPLMEIFPTFTRLLAERGVIMLYKGKRDNIVSEIGDLESTGYHPTWSIEPLYPPLMEKERNMLIISGWRKDE